MSCHTISQSTPVGARALAETSKSPSTDVHHNNPKKKQNPKFEIYLTQRRDSKSRLQLSHLLFQYYLTLYCFSKKHDCGMSCRECQSTLIIKMKKIPFSHPLKSCFCLTYQQPQQVHETSGAQTAAQLAAESIQPGTGCLGVTGLQYVGDYNYQRTSAVIFLFMLTSNYL